MLAKKSDKFIILICSVSFFYLSYVNIAEGLNSQMDVATVSGNSLGIGYFLFLLFCTVFIIGHNKSDSNLSALLLGFYIYFLSVLNGAGLSALLGGLGLLLWVFSYSYGNRISACSHITIDFFKTSMFLGTIVLSFYCLYFYFVKGFFYNQLTTDTVFFLVAYLPFLFLYDKSKLIKLLAIILFVVACLLSLKRSIVVGFGLFFLVFLLCGSKKHMLRKWYFWLILGLIIGTGVFINNSIGEVLVNRFAETSETGGNGRVDIYLNIWNQFKHSSIPEQLFGHGYMAVKRINYDILAHNDFLQLLYDGGLMGVLLYLIFWFFLIRIALLNWHKRKVIGNAYSVYVATLVLYLTLSMMNCFIYSYMLISPLMLAVGFLVGDMCNYYKKT